MEKIKKVAQAVEYALLLIMEVIRILVIMITITVVFSLACGIAVGISITVFNGIVNLFGFTW